MHISVITTKRAYEELEKDGFIYTLPGKGSFVAKKNTALIKEENLRQIEEHLDEVMKLSASCGLKKEDIIEMLEILFGEEEQ